MNCRVRSLVLIFVISVWTCAAALGEMAAADKAKDEPAPAASAAATTQDKDKAAKEEPAPAAAKTAKEEPAAAKPAKEEPAQAAAAKSAKEEPAPAAATPPAPTYTVKREPFKIQFELEGSFESREMIEIVFHP